MSSIILLEDPYHKQKISLVPFQISPLKHNREKTLKTSKKQIIIYTQLDDLTIYHKFMIPGCNSKKLKHIKKNKN